MHRINDFQLFYISNQLKGQVTVPQRLMVCIAEPLFIHRQLCSRSQEGEDWRPNLTLLNADVENCCLSQFHSPSLPGKSLGKLFMQTFTIANSCIFLIFLLTDLKVSLTSRNTEHLYMQPKLMGAVLQHCSIVLYNTGYQEKQKLTPQIKLSKLAGTFHINLSFLQYFSL